MFFKGGRIQKDNQTRKETNDNMNITNPYTNEG